MCDDVNGPQQVWHRHGKLEQSYGLPSPRLRDRPDDRRVREAFVEVMGGRIGATSTRRRPGARRSPEGDRCATRSLAIIRAARPRRRASTARASRSTRRARHVAVQPVPEHHRARVRRHAQRRAVPSGRDHRDAYMDVFTFERVAPATRRAAARSRSTMELAPDGRSPARPRPQPGSRATSTAASAAAPTRPHAPHGLAHRGVPDRQPAPNLEEFLDISPSELTGLTR